MTLGTSMCLALRAATLCKTAVLPFCRTHGFSNPCSVRNKNAPTSGASLFLAERQGFEPWNTREDVTGIPVQRLRPLGHLSETSIYQRS